jgi:PmbA protein
MGTQVFAPSLTIVDDPLRLRGLGSKAVDAEGLATAPLTLVEKGMLRSWLLDTRSAAQLGLSSTAHASRGLSGNPSPSSTNLSILPSSVAVAELYSDIKLGVYITETFGMGVNTITGDYSQGASGFLIENGELTRPISEFTIAGHLGSMFSQMAVANDLVWDYATTTPTLRIDQMTIAGV